MFSKLIASGTKSNISALAGYESKFPENSRGRLDLELNSVPSGSVVSGLDDLLRNAGISNVSVTSTGKTVHIGFQKKMPPLAIIAGALAVSIVVVALVVSWKLYQLSSPAVVGISSIVVIILSAGVLFTIFAIYRRT